MSAPGPGSPPTAPTAERRVMLLGAATPIGVALTHELLAQGIGHVLAVDPPDLEAPRPTLSSPALTRVEADLTRSRARRLLLFGPAREHAVDTIVDLAMHRSARATGARAHALNVESTRELLMLCERHPTISNYVLRSFAEVYEHNPHRPTVMIEDHPLDLRAPTQWRRDRVEADLVACTRIGVSRLRIAVLRTAECLAPETGSQLFDYLQSRVCLRPLGFDPILNVATLGDLARALSLAVVRCAHGIYNVPGADTLPLSRIIRLWGRAEIPLPPLLLEPLYTLRAALTGRDFSYRINRERLRFGGVLDGTRALHDLGYRPEHPVAWPAPSTPT